MRNKIIQGVKLCLLNITNIYCLIKKMLSFMSILIMHRMLNMLILHQILKTAMDTAKHMYKCELQYASFSSL